MDAEADSYALPDGATNRHPVPYADANPDPNPDPDPDPDPDTDAQPVCIDLSSFGRVEAAAQRSRCSVEAIAAWAAARRATGTRNGEQET